MPLLSNGSCRLTCFVLLPVYVALSDETRLLPDPLENVSDAYFYVALQLRTSQ